MPEKINEGMALVAIADVRMDPSNVRAHGERNIETIKGSLSRFGQQKPIVIDRDGVVVAGNGTLEAARSLGWERIGVVYSDLVGSDRTGYAIADNRTAELAEWDTDALSSQLNALRMDEDFDLSAIGFTDDEVEVDAIGRDLAVEEKHVLQPYQRVHILFSFHPDVFPEIEGALSKLVEHPLVEHEQSQNG